MGTSIRSERAKGRRRMLFGVVMAAALVSVSVVNSQDNSFIDKRNKQKYRTVKIGNTTWMAENLNYKTGKSWCYNDNKENCKYFGRLYDWETANKACPAEWRLPTHQDWKDLEKAAGGDVAAKKLKEGKRQSHRDKKVEVDWGGTDDFGFSAKGAGMVLWGNPRNSVHGDIGYWWSASTTESGNGDYWSMFTSNDKMLNSGTDKGYGLSVRCVR